MLILYSQWEKFKLDYYRTIHKKITLLDGSKNILRNHALRYELYCRMLKNEKVKKYIKGRFSRKYGLEFNMDKIGPGLYLGHPYNITINRDAVIGKCCNIHKGVTIGQENRGIRKGAPKIGDYVYIGTNAVVVGNVIIGNDVLIAPCSYVNVDVPDHSIVLGNPCTIHFKEKATEDYINYTDMS